MNKNLPAAPAHISVRAILLDHFAALPILLFLLSAQLCRAGSATWSQTPTSGDWNTGVNWTPETVPNGIFDTATFDVSNTTDIGIATNIQVAGILFNSDAAAFSTTVSSGQTLTMSSTGVINNSAVTQNFVTAPGQVPSGAMILFSGPPTITAGEGVVYTNNGSIAPGFTAGSVIKFSINANAGSASFINKGGPLKGKGGGSIFFNDQSTATNASFVNEQGAASGASGGQIQFYNDSNAGTANFTLQGSSLPLVSGGYAAGTMFFNDSSSAGNATFFLEGGQVDRAPGAEIQFYNASQAGNAFFTVGSGAVAGSSPATLTFVDDATPENATITLLGGVNGAPGGTLELGPSKSTARIEVFGNAVANCYAGATVGSLEGDGSVFASYGTLIVGTNNLDTVFSGVLLADTLVKTGVGTLSLFDAENDVTQLVVADGTLLVKSGAGFGSSGYTIQVRGGRLAGQGPILSQTWIGTGHGRGAYLSPGNRDGLGTLTFEQPLAWEADGVYSFKLNSVTAKSDRVLANGVVIHLGATFIARDLGAMPLSSGTTFLAINNRSANAITGTFANLPDGSSFTLAANTYLVSYEGGDGNDLTLTVQ